MAACIREINIEELERMGQDMMRQEFPKPTEEDVVLWTPLIMCILGADEPLSAKALSVLTRRHKYNGKRSFLFQIYLTLVERGEICDSKDDVVRQSLQIKAVKSWSGVCNITVFTAPFPEYTNTEGERVKQSFSCPFNCSFCPSEPNMPKSYLTLEPATLRARKHEFDCVAQMHDRMNTLYLTGHGTLSKLEVNVLGGTFSCYPDEYREEFVRDIYYAANIFWDHKKKKETRPRLSLQEEKDVNDMEATCKVVQIVIETRPDSITSKELKFLRHLSVTRIQMGVQHTDDYVLDMNRRKCPPHKTIAAIEAAKRIGMKIDAHFMPNLPFTTPEKDKNMLLEHIIGLSSPVRHMLVHPKRSWKDWWQGNPAPRPEQWEIYDVKHPEFQTDQLKIYPTAVTVYTEIEHHFKAGTYVPYEEPLLLDMLLEFKAAMFPWIRLNRIMRDFYADNIFSQSGSNLNMRNELHEILAREGKRCACIRCREAKLNKITDDWVFVIRKYNASNGVEFFISAESPDNKILYGFVRLRLDDAQNKIFPELNRAALLREAHVYSTATAIGKQGNIQHRGLGTQLMLKAESIAKSNKYKTMAVISAVGSRGFYRKLGYTMGPPPGEYMFKPITQN